MNLNNENLDVRSAISMRAASQLPGEMGGGGGGGTDVDYAPTPACQSKT